MTGQIHKIIVTVSSLGTGIGAFILGTDTVPFGLDAYDWGLSLIWTGTILNIVATVVRANWIPGTTTGVGNEPPA